MSTFIHPTAIVDPKAQIGTGVTIGPYSIIGPHVVLGDHVNIHAHVVVDGHTQVGAHGRIFPFASIGTIPQDLKYQGEESELIIGSHVTIREHVTMNPGTQGGGMKTIVGHHCLFMMATHVAHDCIIGDHVILANNATLGGHVVVGDHVLIGGLAAVHQFVRIGSYAVIGGMSGVESDVIPFGRVKGERAHLAGLNLVGLERGGFDKGTIKTLQKVVRDLFEGEGTFESRLEGMMQQYEGDQTILKILTFAKNKERFGLCQPDSRKAA